MRGADTLRLEPAALAAGFAQRLHAAGLAVGAERAGRFAAALRLVPPTDRSTLYWTARAVFVSDPGTVGAFDAVFAAVFGGEADLASSRNPDAPRSAPAPLRPADPLPSATAGAGDTATRPTPDASEPSGRQRRLPLAVASQHERLRRTAFPELSDDELALLRRWIGEVALAPPPRRSRRARAHHSGQRLDLRRTLRAARRTGGDPLRLVRRTRKLRHRRLVLVCDVSGSMEPYTRAFLLLLQGAVAGAAAEAFVFSTRLTRLTGALAGRDPDAALRRAAETAPDWTGGTRLGVSLARLVRDHGHRARGAVVVILSDGWEREDPARVGEQMARLSRLAYRIVWVNPRVAAGGYAPRAGGMAAALPHVDALVSGHSLAALEEVAAAVRGKAPRWRSTTRSR
ncbi:MAG: VWA domain-containing protein [Euzebyales bacterium]|nr:VWA domain-containing protein [Euzebyales bacterium]